MIKPYIFMPYDISNIGGTQTYMVRKAEYLKSSGYLPIIIAYSFGTIIMEQLKEFPILILPEVIFPCYYFSNKKQEIITIKLYEFIKQHVSDEYLSQGVIESHTTQTSTWGERLSSLIKCVNLIYPMRSHPINSPEDLKFYSYKLKEGQLIGSTSESISILFNNMDLEKINYKYINIMTNTFGQVSDDVNIDMSHEIGADYCILTIARIEKSYLIHMVSELILLANKYSHIKFAGTFIISRQEGVAFNRLKKAMKVLPNNLKIKVLGPLVPLPRNLFLEKRIYIGMGSTCLLTASFGLPTLPIDPKTNKSMGFFGVDSYNYCYNKQHQKSISDELIPIILDDSIFTLASEKSLELYNKEFEPGVLFEDFMSYAQSQKSVEYYKFSEIRHIDLPLKSCMKKIVIRVFGAMVMVMLTRVYRNIRGNESIK